MNQINYLKMAKLGSETSWLLFSWPAHPTRSEELCSVQLLHMMLSSGANSTWTMSLMCPLEQGNCSALSQFLCFFVVGGHCLFHLLGISDGGKQKLALTNYKVCFLLRNSAVETVEQELLFVGSETGKLLAMRELTKKVYFQINFLIKFTKPYIISGRLSTIQW